LIFINIKKLYEIGEWQKNIFRQKEIGERSSSINYTASKLIQENTKSAPPNWISMIDIL